MNVVVIFANDIVEATKRRNVVNIKGAVMVRLLQPAHLALITIALACKAALSIPVETVVTFPATAPSVSVFAAVKVRSPGFSALRAAIVMFPNMATPKMQLFITPGARCSDLSTLKGCAAFIATKAMVTFILAGWAGYQVTAMVAGNGLTGVLRFVKASFRAICMGSLGELTRLAKHDSSAQFAGYFNLSAISRLLTFATAKVARMGSVRSSLNGLATLGASDGNLCHKNASCYA